MTGWSDALTRILAKHQLADVLPGGVTCTCGADLAALNPPLDDGSIKGEPLALAVHQMQEMEPLLDAEFEAMKDICRGQNAANMQAQHMRDCAEAARDAALARAQQAEAEQAELLAAHEQDLAENERLASVAGRLAVELAEYREAMVVANKAWANEAAKVQAVEALHRQYLPSAVDFYCCAECNRVSGEYVPWPCDTAKALADVSSEPEDEPPLEPGVRPCCGDVHFGDGCPEDGGQQ